MIASEGHVFAEEEEGDNLSDEEKEEDTESNPST